MSSVERCPLFSCCCCSCCVYIEVLGQRLLRKLGIDPHPYIFHFQCLRPLWQCSMYKHSCRVGFSQLRLYAVLYSVLVYIMLSIVCVCLVHCTCLSFNLHCFFKHHDNYTTAIPPQISNNNYLFPWAPKCLFLPCVFYW